MNENLKTLYLRWIAETEIVAASNRDIMEKYAYRKTCKIYKDAKWNLAIAVSRIQMLQDSIKDKTDA
jgi:hypothetical protein